jgi:hypothetical protein
LPIPAWLRPRGSISSPLWPLRWLTWGWRPGWFHQLPLAITNAVPRAPFEQACDCTIEFGLVLRNDQVDKLLFAGSLRAGVPHKESFEGRKCGNHRVAVGYRLVIWSGSCWRTASASLNETGTPLCFRTHQFTLDMECRRSAPARATLAAMRLLPCCPVGQGECGGANRRFGWDD